MKSAYTVLTAVLLTAMSYQTKAEAFGSGGGFGSGGPLSFPGASPELPTLSAPSGRDTKPAGIVPDYKKILRDQAGKAGRIIRGEPPESEPEVVH